MRQSLYGGYPFDGVKSQEILPNRVGTHITDGKVGFIYDTSKFTIEKEDDPEHQKSFAMDRAHDFSVALNVAEQQILDIYAAMRGYPFIPQDFGFEETDIILKENEYSPKVYKKGDFLITNFEDQTWLLSGPESMSNAKIKLDNSHIAFTVLRSLGVISDEELEQPKDGDIVAHVNEETGKHHYSIKGAPPKIPLISDNIGQFPGINLENN